MRLPNSAQTSQPWRIHQLTRDFRLEDVWALPTPGGPDDFPRLLQLIASVDPSDGSSSAVVRALFAIRWKLGELFSWDDPDGGRGSPRPTLRDQLPTDLLDTPSGPAFDAVPFTPLYLTDREWAAEIVNRTVHGVMHIGWVPVQGGGYRGQMSVYVKRNGLFGRVYMAAFAPFRHALVYPLMLRRIGREWQARTGELRASS
jgi:hypothetical protein